jgi:signal transduction histidine kinase
LKVEALRSAGRDSIPPADSDQRIDEATAALTQTHRRIAMLVREMSNAVPTRLESEGLAAALQSALEHDFRDSFDSVGWEAEPAAIEQAKRLPLFASEVVFYAAQEALRNAAKHGRGDDAHRPLHLDVTLRNRSGLELIIEDDGVGRQIDQTHEEPGSGLRFHTTMLAVIGGALSVDDRSGGGTRVVVALGNP